MYAVRHQNLAYLSAWRLRIVVTAVGMDPRVFVFGRSPPDPRSGETADTFYSVASPVDMEEYPPDEPDPQTEFQMFRADTVDVLLRSASEYEGTLDLIERELRNLVHALNILENLRLDRTIEIGPYPSDPDHTSESVAI